MKKLLPLLALLLPALARAQEGPADAVVSNAERQHAAMMILVLVVLGMMAILLLLWSLRRKGLLREEKPDDPLRKLQDEIARRSDELAQK